MTDNIVGTEMRGWQVGPSFETKYRGAWLTVHACYRKCADCGILMHQNATRDALEGRAKNNGLSYARCEACRSRRNNGAGSRWVSPPVVIDAVTAMAKEYATLLKFREDVGALIGYDDPRVELCDDVASIVGDLLMDLEELRAKIGTGEAK